MCLLQILNFLYLWHPAARLEIFQVCGLLRWHCQPSQSETTFHRAHFSLLYQGGDVYRINSNVIWKWFDTAIFIVWNNTRHCVFVVVPALTFSAWAAPRPSGALSSVGSLCWLRTNAYKCAVPWKRLLLALLVTHIITVAGHTSQLWN